MKLKTLKNLNNEQGFASICTMENHVDAEDLKKEAIKWVKLRNTFSGTDWQKVFIDFHNITEEDLKDATKTN